MPFTEADLLPELAPVAEQVRLNILRPPTSMMIDSDPEGPFDPDQDPEARQVVAKSEDQVRVTEELTSAELADVESLTATF